jgi:hypothetical protein
MTLFYLSYLIYPALINHSLARHFENEWLKEARIKNEVT